MSLRSFRIHVTPSSDVIDSAVCGTMLASLSSYIRVSKMAKVGAPSSVDAVEKAGSRLLKSVVASFTIVPPDWMSVRGAVDAVVLTLMILAAIGAALLVVALVLPRLTVVADLTPVVVAVGAAVVLELPVDVGVVSATDDGVVSATDVVVLSAAGFLLPPP